MPDQLLTEPTPGTAQPPADQATIAPTAEPTAPTAQPDTKGLIEQMRAELRAEFDAKYRSIQSKSDRAYAAALRDAKVVDEIAAATGLEPDKVAAAKKAITDKRFGDIFSEEPPQQQAPPNKVWTRDELQLAAKTQYDLDPADLDVSQWAGLANNDPRGASYHDAAKRAQEAKKTRLAAAQGVAQNRAQFGTAAPAPGGTAGASAATITKQLGDLLNLPPTGDIAERNRRKVEADRLESELDKYENSARVSPYDAWARAQKPPE